MSTNPLLPEFRHMAALAVPLVLTQLAQKSMGFVDTLMVGRLGSAELAGIALGSTVFFFLLLVCGGVILSVGPVVAQAVGAGNEAMVGRAVRQGLWLALGLTLPAFVLLWSAEPLLLAMGQEPATVTLTVGYLKAISWGFLPGLWVMALRGLLEGLARPRPIMVIAFIGVGLNVLSNNALMFGRWGFPALGLVGTGYATTFVYWMMFFMTVLYVQLAFRERGIFSTLRTPDLATLRELFRIGWPIGLTLGFETGLFFATALLMGLLGSTQLAAHQIALQTATMTFMIPLGLSIATSIRVGQAAGRRDLPGVQQAGLAGISLSLVFMTLTALTFWLLPERIIGFYIDVTDPANRLVIELAVVYLGIAAMFQLFDGLQVSTLGALRGLKDTRVPMFVTLFAYWVAGFGTGVVLTFVFGLGGRGLWFGLVTGLGVAGVLLLVRFAHNLRHGETFLAQAEG